MSVPERDPQEWLRRAQSDLLNIDNNLNSAQVPWDTIVFHAQQVCEKLLKALILQRGNIPSRTHDLGLLLNMCSDLIGMDPSLPAEMDRIMLLFGSRYPDTKWPSEREARAAVSIAKKLATLLVPMIRPRA
jgi:HEPN domain-containing protein